MESYVVEMDIDSIMIHVIADSPEEAGDKAYLKLTSILKEKQLENMIKVYPLEAKTLQIKKDMKNFSIK